MTSLQWIYEDGTDGPTRMARKEAMAYADEALRGVVTAKSNPTDVEREVLRVRKAELTWSDLRSTRTELDAQVSAPAVTVKTIAYGVFWGGILLIIVDAILYAILRAMS